MKKVLGAFFIAVIFGSAAFAASTSELRKMSVFISNFTEVGLYNIDIDDISDGELAHFGIWHNWKNNDSRIQKCPNKRCPYGRYVIDKKYVAESVRKYFDLDIRHNNAKIDGTLSGHYDGKRYYHFEGATGEAVQARVTNVRRNGGVITMRGKTYNPDNEEIEGRAFTATAVPYRYNGKDTWSILTLETED